MARQKVLAGYLVFIGVLLLVVLTRNVRNISLNTNFLGSNTVTKDDAQREIVSTLETAALLLALNDSFSLTPGHKDMKFPLHQNLQLPNVEIEAIGHVLKFGENVKPRAAPDNIRVHLVFHSHVDPGWLKTFEDYYTQQVQSIISNAVESLRINPDLRFIWSETSFLERWWMNATDQEKSSIIEQVKSGQLEISGGSWVMTDEATPTFYAAIENMIEGHHFIYEKFKIIPNTSWSVDPFGHGAMMPELLHRAGIDNMVIGRFNDHIKQYLRNTQALRWQWIPPYFQKLEGPRVNSLPRLVYTTSDACEKPEVCKCYHVGLSALYQGMCPEGKINNITNNTIEFITTRFVSEMRKNQKMYGTRDILVPIGDDFFFGYMADWLEMYDGYTAMIDWLKQHPELKAEMRFSTVTDFFNAISGEKLNTLRGDFFPYTEHLKSRAPWWTGFFVHRANAKAMERRLQVQYSGFNKTTTSVDISKLKEAKRQLTLFQHHDGITGTSNPSVMNDYQKRMAASFDFFEETFLRLCSNNTGKLAFDATANKFNVLEIGENATLYLSAFSSLTYEYRILLRIEIEQPVKVFSLVGEEIPTQTKKYRCDRYQVEFFATLSPLQFTTFRLESIPRLNNTATAQSKCWMLNETTGQIQSLILGNDVIPFNLSLVELGDTGGAYVFIPDGTRTLVSPNNSRSIPGLFERLELTHYTASNLSVNFSCHGEGDLTIEMSTDMKMRSTLALFLNTGIKSKSFYTDVNGMYHLRREYQRTFENQSLNIDANVYPVATSVFIQDSNYRLTVVTGQPTGASSEETGNLVIYADRRVNINDGKGLTCTDCSETEPAHPKYRILLERKKPTTPTPKHSYASLKAEQNVAQLIYSPILVATKERLPGFPLAIPKNWPCGIQLVSWRPLMEGSWVIILRRFIVDETVVISECEQTSVTPIYDFLTRNYKRVMHTKLSAVVDEDEITLESFAGALAEPYSIASFRLY